MTMLPVLLRRLRRRWRRDTDGVADPTERALRQRIRAGGGSMEPTWPADAWRGRRNRALLTSGEVDAAVAEVAAAGLVPHGDRPKNWDLSIALGTILERTTREARILEMGAARYSPLLVWLYQFGYRHLHGIDLVYQEPERHGPILFEQMDLTRTSFEDEAFDAIACLSVIEHGVEPAEYLAEARRLLRPGGVLITSTDYWCEPVDTAGITAYGGPVRIMDRAAIDHVLGAAADAGFHLEGGTVDLACRDRVVHWKRTSLDFTFLEFTLIAPGTPTGPGLRSSRPLEGSPTRPPEGSR